jgi:hypothetical protein
MPLIILNLQEFPALMRSKTLGILRDCLDILHMVKDEYPQAPAQYLTPVATQWLPVLMSHLQSTRIEWGPVSWLYLSNILRVRLHNYDDQCADVH